MSKIKTKKYSFSIKDLQETSNSISFILDGEFIPASRPRVGRYGTYYSEPYKTYKKEFELFCQEHFQKYYDKFYEQALELSIIFHKAIPKSYSKIKHQNLYNKPNLNRPDLDNYLKSIMDGLNGTLYSDDSFIYSINSKKIWSDNNYIQITISF